MDEAISVLKGTSDELDELITLYEKMAKLEQAITDIKNAIAETWGELVDEGKVAIGKTEEFLKETAKKAKDISLIRHVYDFEYEYVRELTSDLEFANNLKDISRTLKLLSGGADIYIGLGKIGTDEWFKGVLETTTGVFKIASVFDVPGADVIYGYTTFASALNDILNFTGETTDEKRWNSYFKAASGASRSLAGVCKVIPGAGALAVPLGLMAGTFSIAARFFEKGKWLEGGLTLALGTLATAVLIYFMAPALAAAFQALMSAIMTAFGSLSASVSAAVAPLIPLWPIWAPIVVFIAYAIIDALASSPKYAEGGFPTTGYPFIARESGPELVGILHTCQGRRTAVINNEQIVEAVSVGVSQAWVAAMRDNFSNGSAIARVFLDGKEIARSTSV